MAQSPIQSRMFGSLQEAYDRLQAIVNCSHDGIYITDGQANTLWVNPSYLSISGLQAQDVLGKNMWDLERSGIINQSGTLLAIAQRRAVTLEQTFRTGKRALITSTPDFGSEGEIVMVVTNVRDMTEYYDLQEKYRQTAERYRSELELAQKQLSGSDLIAADPNTLAVLSQVDRVASLDATVLLTGETGVGKEKFAHYIYQNSARRRERFIPVNCGAIPPALMESELFGYEQGAFTGASRHGKMGIFELADKGTIFLDEIGELPLDMQVKLLRVLQDHQIQRVGGTRAIPVDVRIIAATNRDLADMVRSKTFREDLFYRLNVVPITIPSLRERPGDILPFLHRFLEELNKKYGFHKEFSTAALQAMEHYPWPGNVRELKNVVERVVILSDADLVLASDLPFHSRWSVQSGEAALDGPVDLRFETAKFEYQYIQKAYEKYQNVRAAAASLGMDSSTFVRKRKKYQELLQK